ncbi:hypothetical protein OROGR_030169 [Orobanche gracilis]
MDGAQWTQEFGVTRSMAEISSSYTRPALMDHQKRVMRPPKDQTLNCPRCHSTNTKFCYYNNYSLTQPRYFCKSCRRYWTEGGTLRNVPVGGGSKKHKSSSISTPDVPPSLSMALSDKLPTSSGRFVLPDLNPPTISISHLSSYQNPKVHDHHRQDLNLGFHYNHGVSDQFLEFPKFEGKDVILSSPPSSSTTPHLPVLDFMGNENIADRGLMNSFIPNMATSSSSTINLDQTNNALFGSGFPFQECKPSLAFSIDDHNINGSRYMNSDAPEENTTGTLMFNLGATKRHSSTSDHEGDDQYNKASHEDNFNGFWSGMLDRRSW